MNNECQCRLDADALNELKKKVTEEYEKYVKRLNRGYKDDYSLILNEISFIETYQYLDNQKLIYEYYINYGL